MADKTCIACAESIKEAAQLCRFCGTKQSTTREGAHVDDPAKISQPEVAPPGQKSRRQPLIIATIIAGTLIATSAIGAIAWQATPPPATEQVAEVPIAQQPESTEPTAEPPATPRPEPSEPEPRPEPRPQAQLEPEPLPPPPMSPEETVAQAHAAEMDRVCEIVVFYDWDKMNASWGSPGHWQDVFRAYDELDRQIGRVISFFEFSMQYERTMEALYHYAQMAQMWGEIDVYTSWEVATPAGQFSNQLNILWLMCGY